MNPQRGVPDLIPFAKGYTRSRLSSEEYSW